MDHNRKTIKVGNLNDYSELLNRINVLENVKLTVDDFMKLDNKYDGEYLSYSIGEVDNDAIAHVRINKDQVINFYKV